MPTVTLSRARLDTVLGFAVPTAEVVAGLNALGFEVTAAADSFEVRPPVVARRHRDSPDDIAEEVLRIAGYDRLPASMPSGPVPAHDAQPLIELRDQLSDALAAAGLQEVITSH